MLLGARALVVAAGAAERRVEPVLASAPSSVTVRSRLRDCPSSNTRPVSIELKDARHDQLLAQFGDAASQPTRWWIAANE